MLQMVYESAAHLPAITLLSVTVLFLVLGRKVPFVAGFCVMFAWLITLDAWVNGAWSPIPEASRTPFEVLFVIVGDWRFFLLVERYSANRLTAGKWARSLLVACIVPLIALLKIMTTRGKVDMQVVYLTYEIAFLAVALVILFVVLHRFAEAEAENRSFLRVLTYFELLQYALWAVGDAFLIAGHSWAMTLRLTGNVFYYALFVPFVWWRSPDSPGRKTSSVVPVTTMAVAALVLSFLPVMAHNRPNAAATSAESPAALSFMEGGKTVRTASLAQMLQSLPVEQVAGVDPYYQHNKRWRAISIENILRSGFGREPEKLADDEFVLRAEDGFAAYFPGKRLLEGGAFVAITDLDYPDWEPIGERKDNPGPFYLVWAKPDQQDLETHARPWALASIEIVLFDSQFPHVRPEGPDLPPAALRGFETFKIQCLPCHSINRSGGKVGPELNVPRNILEYRDTPVVEAFIKNPLAFRYTIMPPHPNMTSGDLNDLIAYFQVMRKQKNDKDAVMHSPAH